MPQLEKASIFTNKSTYEFKVTHILCNSFIIHYLIQYL